MTWVSRRRYLEMLAAPADYYGGSDGAARDVLADLLRLGLVGARPRWTGDYDVDDQGIPEALQALECARKLGRSAAEEEELIAGWRIVGSINQPDRPPPSPSDWRKPSRWPRRLGRPR